MEIMLMGVLAFALPFVTQTALLLIVRRQPFRWAGLLYPILFFLLALAALTVDESGSFISLKTLAAAVLAAAGLLSLTGCGGAWLVWKLLLGGKYLK